MIKNIFCLVILANICTVAFAQSSGSQVFDVVLRHVNLDEALAEFSSITGAGVTYDPRLVEGRTVYCVAENASLEHVLECILNDTNLTYARLASGTFVVMLPGRLPPQEGFLSGIVQDKSNGAPLPQAHILLASNTVDFGTVTNSQGQFTLPPLLPGTYLIQASFLGYDQTIDTLKIVPGETTFRRVELSAEPVTITPIVINGLHLKNPSSELEKILLVRGNLDNYLSTSNTSSAASQFKAVPGLQISDITADIYMQGSNTGEHQFKLDGVPVFLPQATIGILGPFSPFAIQSFTILKSGFGVEAGSQLAGVINAKQFLGSETGADIQLDPTALNARFSLITEYDNHKYLTLMGAARTSLWQMYQVPQLQNMLNTWSKPDPFLIFAPIRQFSAIDPNFFQDILNLNDIPGTGLSFYDLHFASQLKTSTLSGFHASLYLGRNEYSGSLVPDVLTEARDIDSEIPEGGSATDPLTTAELSLSDSYEWQNIAGQLKYHTVLGKNILFNIQGRSSLYNLDQSYVLLDSLDQFISEIPPAVDENSSPVEIDLPKFEVTDTNSISEYAIESQLDIAWGPHAILLGLESTYNISKLDVFLTSLPNLESGSEITNFVELSTEQERVGYESSTSRFALYINDRIHFSNNVLLEVGLRSTYLPDRHTLYAEPRFALRFDFPTKNGSFAMQSAGGVYRQYVLQFDVSTQNAGALFPSKRVWFPINGDIRPPTAYHLTQSFLYRPSENWTFQIEGFLKIQQRLWFMNYLTRNQDTQSRFIAENYTTITDLNDILSEGTGLTTGVSASLVWNLGPLKTRMIYDFTSIERESEELFDGTTFSAPWEEPHRLSSSIEFKFNNRVFLMTRFTGIWGRSWAFRQAYYDFFGHSNLLDYQNNIDFSSPDAHTLPPFLQVDAGLAYNLSLKTTNVQVRIDLLNIFDRNNVADQRLVWVDGALVTENRYFYPFIPTMALRLNW